VCVNSFLLMLDLLLQSLKLRTFSNSRHGVARFLSIRGVATFLSERENGFAKEPRDVFRGYDYTLPEKPTKGRGNRQSPSRRGSTWRPCNSSGNASPRTACRSGHNTSRMKLDTSSYTTSFRPSSKTRCAECFRSFSTDSIRP